MEKPFSIDFDKLENYLDNMAFSNERSKEIISKAGFTDSQVKIINSIVLSALKAYDLQKNL